VELTQRRLQFPVGELLAGARFEMHGCDLHDSRYYSAATSAAFDRS
jgi:hypothetical protein